MRSLCLFVGNALRCIYPIDNILPFVSPGRLGLLLPASVRCLLPEIILYDMLAPLCEQ